MKLRRSIHTLTKFLGKIYDPKNATKIENELKTVRKRIVELETLLEKNKLKEELPELVFSQTIYKTLRTHFGTRDINQLTTKEV